MLVGQVIGRTYASRLSRGGHVYRFPRDSRTKAQSSKPEGLGPGGRKNWGPEARKGEPVMTE